MDNLQKQLQEARSKAVQPFDSLDKAINPERLARSTQTLLEGTKNTGKELQQRGKRVIDLGKRFEKAFGFVSGNVPKDLQNKGFKTAIQNAGVYVKSNTTFETMLLRNGSTELVFDYYNLNDSLGGLFAPPPIVSFSKSKRQERTVLDGPEGEVVEKYGHEPWSITIRGLLIDTVNHNYPSQKVRTLISVFNTDDMWEVESEIFQDHGIRSIYFEQIDSEGVESFDDTWSYTLKAFSIKPVEFFLRKK